jgi:glycosyltransferase involved in cell wall biosynthesis
VALGLSDWLLARDAEVVICGLDGPLSKRLPAGAVYRPFRGPGFLSQALSLLLACARFKPAVLHAHQRREALMCLLVGAIMGIPTVEHAHTYLPTRTLARLSFLSRHVFAVSERVREMVVAEFGREPGLVSTIGNVPATADRDGAFDIRRRRDEVVRLVGVGRLVEQKDPERFVRVVAELASIVPVEAVWYGTGPLLDAACAAAARSGAPVAFAGSSDDIARHLDESHVLLTTSRWEGLPLSSLEAFARRRPVVGTAAAVGRGIFPSAAVLAFDDAASDATAAAIIADLVGDAQRVAAQTEAADRYLEGLTADRVYAPVLRAYRALQNPAPGARPTRPGPRPTRKDQAHAR